MRDSCQPCFVLRNMKRSGGAVRTVGTDGETGGWLGARSAPKYRPELVGCGPAPAMNNQRRLTWAIAHSDSRLAPRRSTRSGIPGPSPRLEPAERRADAISTPANEFWFNRLNQRLGQPRQCPENRRPGYRGFFFKLFLISSNSRLSAATSSPPAGAAGAWRGGGGQAAPPMPKDRGRL